MPSITASGRASTSGAAATLSLSATVATGDRLLSTVFILGTTAITSAIRNSQNGIRVGMSQGHLWRCETWAWDNPSTGTHNIVFTPAASVKFGADYDAIADCPSLIGGFHAVYSQAPIGGFNAITTGTISGAGGRTFGVVKAVSDETNQTFDLQGTGTVLYEDDSVATNDVHLASARGTIPGTGPGWTVGYELDFSDYWFQALYAFGSGDGPIEACSPPVVSNVTEIYVTSAATTATQSFTAEAGKPLYVLVTTKTAGSSVAVSGVTFGGVALTMQFGHSFSPNIGTEAYYIFSLANPTPGTANIVVTAASSTTFSGVAFNVENGPADGGIVAPETTDLGFATHPSPLAVRGLGYQTTSLVFGLITVERLTSPTLTTGGATSLCARGTAGDAQASMSAAYAPGNGGITELAWSYTDPGGSTEAAGMTFVIPSRNCNPLSGGCYQLLMGNTSGDSPSNGTLFDFTSPGEAFIMNSGDGGFRPLSNGTIRSLRIRAHAAPGAGKSVTYTVVVNGTSTTAIDTLATVTISDSATEAEISGLSVSFYKFTNLSIRRTSVGSPTLSYFSYAMEIEWGEEGVSMVGGGAQTTVPGSAGTSKFVNLLSPGPTTSQSTAAAAESVVACDGVFEALMATYQVEIADSEEIEYSLYKNGVKQDGSGGTVDTTCTAKSVANAGNTGRSTAYAAFSLPVVAGDRVAVCIKTITAGGGLRTNWFARFKATTNGQFNIGGRTDFGASSSEQFITPTMRSGPSGGSSGTDGTMTTVIKMPVLSTPLLIEGLRARNYSAGPGSGRTTVYTLRKNAASSAIAATFSGTGTGQDVSGSGSVSFDHDDELNIRIQNFNGVTQTGSFMGEVTHALCGYMDPAGVAPPPTFRVTQLDMFVVYDEDAEDDTVTPSDPCSGGGTVPSGTNPSASSLANLIAPEFKLEIDLLGGTTIRLAKGEIPDVAGYCEPIVQSFGDVERAASNTAGAPPVASLEPVLIDTAGTVKGYIEDGSLLDRPARLYVRDGSVAGASWVLRFQGTVVDYPELSEHTVKLVIEDRLSALVTAPFSDRRQLPDALMDGTNVTDQNPTQSLHGKPFRLLYGALSDEALGDAAIGVVPLEYAAQTSAFASEIGPNLDFYIGGLGYVSNIHHVFGAPNFETEGEPTTRERIPDSAWGVWAWAPFKPGWPYPDNWITIGGKRYTGVLLDQSSITSRLAREGRVPLTMNLCGYPGVNGQMLDRIEDQWVHFHLNFVFASYDGTGAFATSIPTVNGYSIIDVDSVTAAKTAGANMFSGGIKGAFIIAHDLQQKAYRDINMQFLRNMGAGTVSFTNAFGQLALSRLDRTSAYSSATSRTDLEHHVKGSLTIRPQGRKVVTLQPYVHSRSYVKALNALAPRESARLPYDEFNGEYLSGILSVGSGSKRALTLELDMIRDDDTAEFLAEQSLDWWAIARQEAEWRERLSGEDLEIGEVAKVTNYKGGSAWTDRRVMVMRGLLHGDRPVGTTMRAIDVEDLLP